MSITSIKRYFVGDPDIVSIVTTDDLETIITPGYISSQSSVIEDLNKGSFEWSNTDAVLINYFSDQIGLFSYYTSDDTLAAFSGALPQSVIRFSGQKTTVGGSASEAFSIPGALSTDKAFVQMVNDGTGNVTILQAVVTANTLTITFSGNPGNNAVFNYQLIRDSV